MKKPVAVMAVLMVLLSALAFIPGCRHHSQMNPRKSNLLAEENIDLTAELKQCGNKLDEQLEHLEQCKQQIKANEKQSEENIAFLMRTVLDEVTRENKRLTDENKKLARKIEQLQKRIDKLRNQSVQ